MVTGTSHPSPLQVNMSIPGVQPQPHHRCPDLVPSARVYRVLLNPSPTLGPNPNLNLSPDRNPTFTLNQILPHRTQRTRLMILMILM